MFSIGAFLSYVLVVSFTPGPNTIMAMANAGKYGFRKALKFNAGVFAGFFIIMLLSSYFNLLFFDLIPRIEFFMQLLGAGFMLYLAFKIMTSREENLDEKDSEKNDINEKIPVNLFFTGFSLQFINPKVIIYSLTVISNFVIPYYKSNIALFLFALLLSLISLLATISWALFGSLFNEFLSKYQRQFNIVMGLLLIYSAISISGLMEL